MLLNPPRRHLRSRLRELGRGERGGQQELTLEDVNQEMID